jgi:hypothetical protein
MKKTKCWIVSLLFSVFVFTGCSTTNSTTGEREFDPVRTEQVKAAIQGVTVVAVRRVLDETHEGSPKVIAYLQQSAGLICKMRDERKFSPVFLIDGLNAGLADTFQNQGVDPMVLDLKELIVTLYKLNYASKGGADLDEEKFVWNLLDVLCNSINQGVADFVISKGL